MSTHTLALVCASDDVENDRVSQRTLRTLQDTAGKASGFRVRVVLASMASIGVGSGRRVQVKQYFSIFNDDSIQSTDDVITVDALLFIDRVPASPVASSLDQCDVILLNTPWSTDEIRRVALDTDAPTEGGLSMQCTIVARQVVSVQRDVQISESNSHLACLCAVDAVAAAHVHVATVDLVVSSDGGVWITAVDCVPTVFFPVFTFDMSTAGRASTIEPVWHGLLAHLACATAEQPVGQLPTLRQWRAVLGEDWKRSIEDNALPGSYASFLRARYDSAVIAERAEAIRQVIRDAVDAGFNLDAPTCIVTSPGRFRVFMGHTDLPGLGGPTINGATREELIGVAQSGAPDGTVQLTNSNSAQFPNHTIDIVQLRRIADDKELWRGTKTFDPRHWHSYVCGALAFMLAAHQCSAAEPLARFFDNNGIRMHVGAVGDLALSYTGGVSSSSSLTGAVTSCVRALSAVRMQLHELTSVDLGEYLLGKMAGSADKTAQMMARRGQLSVVGSLPDRFLTSMELPSSLAVLMAECDIPRLTTTAGAAYLAKRHAGDEAGRLAVEQWAQRTMRCNSSRAFLLAVRLLREALLDEQRTTAAGLTTLNVFALRTVLASDETPLRELCAGASLAQLVSSLPMRHAMLYRLLKLLPLEAKSDDDVIAVRRAALYGLSEVERGVVYVRQALVCDNGDTILRLVRTAHDGDRAFVDDRTMRATAWASDARVDVSDATLERLSTQCAALSDDKLTHECLLHWRPGGFERSLAAVDERADELRRAFDGRAELRIAAAGLGGAVAIHCYADLVPAVIELLKSWHWSARVVRAGSQTQVFCL